jgi:hypothetical protein
MILRFRPASRCPSAAMQILNSQTYHIPLRLKSSNASGGSKPHSKPKTDKRDAKTDIPKKVSRDPLQGMRESAQRNAAPKYRPIQPDNPEEKWPDETEPSESTLSEAETSSIERQTKMPSSIGEEPEKRPKLASVNRSVYTANVAPGGGPPLSSSSRFPGGMILNIALLLGGIFLISRYMWKKEEKPQVIGTPVTFIPRRNIEKALTVLKDIFQSRFSTDENELAEFTGEGIVKIGSNQKPMAIVWPESTEEVEVILNIAEKYGLPIIPYSGGTSIEGYTF